MQCKTLFLIVIRWLGLNLATLAVITTTIVASDAISAEYDLFVSFAGGGGIEDYVASKDFKRLPIIYKIDINNNGKLDLEQYIALVKKEFRDYVGPVALDWEGKAYRNLIGVEKSDLRTRDVIDEYVKSVDVLQSHSTAHINIGFYGFPSKRSTRQNSTMEEKDNLRKIYGNIEILYPSLYLNNRVNDASVPIKFAQDHLQNALKIACEDGKHKKVYAFITHRWHPKSRFTPNSLIPLDVFEDYVEAIRDVRYKECKIDGIVWWGADEHWYKKGWRKVIVMSIDSYSSIMDYSDKVIDKYADIILKYYGE